MHMGMVPLVVKSGVPFQMVGGIFNPSARVTAWERSKSRQRAAVVEAQSLGVLPAQREDERPHRPPVSVQLLGHLGEDDRLPGAGEQAMVPLFFHPRAGGHVRHVALYSRAFRPLPCGDVLGVAATGAGFVVFEVAEFRDKQGHACLLFLPL